MAKTTMTREEFQKQISDSVKAKNSNSKEFMNVVNAISMINNLGERPATEENLEKLEYAQSLLKDACKTYLEKNTVRLSGTGRERRDLVHGLYDIVASENLKDFHLKVIGSNGKYSEGKTLNDAIAESRIQRIDITNQKGERVGAGVSSRLRIGGGFFTEETHVMDLSSEEKKDDLERIKSRQGRKRADKDKTTKYAVDFASKNLSREAKSILGKMPKVEGMTSDCVYYPKENDGKTRSKKSFKTDQALVVAEHKEEIIDYYRDVYQATPKVAEELYEFQRKKVAKATECYQAFLDVGMKYGAELSSRNVASSRLASLLGHSEVIAGSRMAVTVNNGVEHKGVIMDDAKGRDASKEENKIVLSKLIPEGKDLFDAFTPEGIKQMAALSVMDLVAGQADRHYQNMFYDIAMTPDGMKIQGVQGIDNDAAFGLFQIRGESLSNIDVAPDKLGTIVDLKCIDKGVLENLQKMEKNLLKYGFGDILDSDELDAMSVRINQVLERVKDKKIEVVEDWATYKDKMAESFRKEKKKEFLPTKGMRILSDVIPRLQREGYDKKDIPEADPLSPKSLANEAVAENPSKQEDVVRIRIGDKDLARENDAKKEQPVKSGEKSEKEQASKSQEKSEKEQATASTHKPVRERVDLREERRNHFIGRARRDRGQIPTAPKKQAEGKSLGK